MENNIIDTLNTSDEWLKLVNSHTCNYFYVKDADLAVSVSNGGSGSMRLLDISNALKRGKMCDMYCIYGDEYQKRWEILEAFNYSCKDLFKACAALEFDDKNKAELMGVTVYISSKKGVSTYSPLHLGHLKPLKEIPKKWSITHVIRLLANDQFEKLETHSRYTDDYAYDNAYNYGAGKYDKHAMLKTLIENPSGWWFRDGKTEGDYLGINCHSFDYKGCNVRLNGAVKAKAPKTVTATTTPVAAEAPKAAAAPKTNVLPFPSNIDRTKAAGIFML